MMRIPTMRMTRAVVSACMIAMLGTAGILAAPQPVHAQTTTNVSASSWNNQQLDALTAPIALYPDALLSQVLMAATYPGEVSQASVWVTRHPSSQGDAAVRAVASQPWDPSVQSLVAFPSVLTMMGAKPDWVRQLGNAFLSDPSGVMDSVQRLRAMAHAAGNLVSTSQQKVIVQQGASSQIIVIQPASPQVVYVPTYNPTVVYGAWPYPAYPPVYVPPPPGYAIASGLAAGIAFGAGVAITNSLWGGFDWNHHDVNINVNHYNNINVNHRIDVNTTTTHWNRTTNYTNRNVNVNRSNHSVHDNYQRRDDSRAQARQTLETRTGQHMSGSGSQRVDHIHDSSVNRSVSATSRSETRVDTHASVTDSQIRSREVNREGTVRRSDEGFASRDDRFTR